MIMKFLKKIPAGMMVVPMLLGAFINTFFPQITGIGSFTTAIFTSAGANTAIGIQLFCLGTTLQVRQMGGVIKTYRDWKLCGDDEWLKNGGLRSRNLWNMPGARTITTNGTEITTV